MALLCEAFDLLDQHVELPAAQLDGLDGLPSSIESIDRCALQVRKGWGLGQGPIPNVLGLLESKGVLICPIPGPSSHVGSFALWFRSRPVVGFPSRQRPSVGRFELAHELGHLLLHADVLAGSLQPERDADRFARALLLPAVTFGGEVSCAPDLEKLHRLERRWGAPLPVLILRAFELGCLAASDCRRLLGRSKERSRRMKVIASENPRSLPERPVLLRHALSLLEPDWPVTRIAACLSVAPTDLQMLTGAAPWTPSGRMAGSISSCAELR